jgi:hypothetical protein
MTAEDRARIERVLWILPSWASCLELLEENKKLRAALETEVARCRETSKHMDPCPTGLCERVAELLR